MKSIHISLIVLILLNQNPPSQGFSIITDATSVQRVGFHGPQKITKLYSSFAKDSASISGQDEALMKQKLAKDALTKLLEKQRREMQTTEELIRNISQNTTTTFSEGVDIAASRNVAPSVTRSIYAGVDYGFVSRSEGCRAQNMNELNSQFLDDYKGPPANIWTLGSQQFMRNLDAMKGEYKDEVNVRLSQKQKKLQTELGKLTLNSTAIWEREESRGEVIAPWVIKIPYYILCFFLDTVFEDKYVFSRFFLLETVARMPYFSYITMLHFYETLGFWRRSNEVKRIHFAEEWNEYHHLLVMESLGGDQSWWVRFMAQHSAIAYYLVLNHLWSLSPSLSYKFSEMLETHAVDTYSQFLDENEEKLQKLPPSLAAIEYYTLGISDPMFGEYQTSALANGGEIRKSGMNLTSLFDVFTAIRADEGDHVGTMKSCLDPKVAVLSPSLESRVLTGIALAASVGYFVSTGGFDGLDDLSTSTTDLVTDLVDTIGGIEVGEEAFVAAGLFTVLMENLRSSIPPSLIETLEDAIPSIIEFFSSIL